MINQYEQGSANVIIMWRSVSGELDGLERAEYQLDQSLASSSKGTYLSGLI